MANCLKQEFKNILLQKARETEENTEQKLINSRIQECRKLFYYYLNKIFNLTI